MVSNIILRTLLSINASPISRFKFKHIPVRVLSFRFCHTNINKDIDLITGNANSDCTKVTNQFPHPKATLHNYYSTVAQELKCSSHVLKLNYQLVRSVGKVEWKCTYMIQWPKEMSFSAVLQNKTLASKQAALKALHWLKVQGKITETGIPVFNIHQDVNESRIPIEITMHESSRQITERHHQFNKQDSNPLVEEKTAPDGHDEYLTKDGSCKELESISLQFPQPKGTLHNCYATVAQDLKNSSYLLKPSYKLLKNIGSKTEWKCTYMVKWPEEMSFSAVMQTKALAGKQAAIKTLHWLTTGGKITKTGAPIVYDRSEVEQHKVPIQISIDNNSNQNIDAILQLYKQKIEPILEERMEHERQDIDITNEQLRSSGEVMESILNSQAIKKSSNALAKRNEMLYRRYIQREEEEYYTGPNTRELPIAKFRSKIVDLVEANRVVIVKGEPGCGKSTQVPQYVFNDWVKRKHGTECNIIITQPRRISAISLAEWVSHERQEKVGDVIGYQVRFKAVLPHAVGGSVLYCSTGILLRRLQNNLGLFGLSHIIVDEAHERDINMDLLIVLLRRALALNPKLRVIVMSATINAEMFQLYFDNAPVLHVPGFTHPVKSHYLEDLKKVNLEQNQTLKDDANPIVDCKLMVKLIHWIDKNKPQGSILCFLPGWAEIKTLLNLLHESKNKNRYLVLPVHSRISHDDQRRIFGVPPPGIRKIILATNIAETSITIDDVVYVVDSGAHKEERYDLERCMPSLDTQWISRANVSQRRGRAGRVKPGESFHLFTRTKYESLDEFPIPEIMRIPLEKTVLDCKLYSPNEKAAAFLAEMPEPPSSQAVDQAIEDLIQLGALDKDEKMTSLGRRIAHFGTHPKLSKALVYAAVFKCIHPMTTIAATLSSDKEVFRGGLLDRAQMRESKRRFHPSSDHLALALMYQNWEMLKDDDVYEARDFCYKMNLSIEDLELICKLRKLYIEYLLQSRMLNNAVDIADLEASCNRNAENNELLKAVLLSGLDNLLLTRNWDFNRGRLKKSYVMLTEYGQRVTVHPKSVNYKREDYPSPFLTSFRQVRSLQRRSILVHETTLLSPLSVLLFISGQIQINKFKGAASNDGTLDRHVLLTLKGHQKIAMLCDESLAQSLIELRKIIWEVVDYFVAVEGEPHDEHYPTISDFRNMLLATLATLLSKASTAVDYKADKLKR